MQLHFQNLVFPELSVSATATYIGHAEIAIGNLIGSVICNIGLIFGAIIIFKSISIDTESFLNKMLFMLVSGILLIGLSIDGILSGFDGSILLLIFIGFLYYNYQLHTSIFKENKKSSSTIKENLISKDIIFFIIGASRL